MMKVLFLMVMIAAAAMVVEAGNYNKKSGSFSLKLLLHNMAQGDVTLKLMANSELLQNAANMEAVAQTGQWTAIGPIIVDSTKSPVVHLSVTVKSSKRVPVKKTLQINLLKYFRYSELKAGSNSLVLTALESWRLKSGKYLVIKLGLREVVLTFKM